jgi:hypothetical protein
VPEYKTLRYKRLRLEIDFGSDDRGVQTWVSITLKPADAPLMRRHPLMESRREFVRSSAANQLNHVLHECSAGVLEGWTIRSADPTPI